MKFADGVIKRNRDMREGRGGGRQRSQREK